MAKRTYEILSKWVGEHCGIRIKFVPNITPQCDVKNKVITLPTNIKDENILPALAIVMHEAGHIKHTSHIPTPELVSDKIDMNLLNAVEDVRINQRLFEMLPNAKEFFRRLYNKMPVDKCKKATDSDKALFGSMMAHEGFPRGFTPSGDVQATMNSLDREFLPIMRGLNHFDPNRDRLSHDRFHNDDDGAKQTIIKGLTEMRKLLGYPERSKSKQKQPDPDSPCSDGQSGDGDGQGGGQGEEKKDGERKKDDAGTGGVPAGQQEEERGESVELSGGGDKDTLAGGRMCTKGVFETTEHTSGVSETEMGSIAYEELTKQKFKDILNVKSKRVVEDGTQLNTDNLIAFLTGDIEELFIDDKIEKTRRSKLLFLIDSSGSMGSKMIDCRSSRVALCNAVGGLTNVLDEVREEDGVSVDYAVRAFDNQYHILTKENWREEYMRCNGGTNLARAFDAAIDEMIKDDEIDGKKMILLFTDGAVGSDDIQHVKSQILQYGSDIRVMICGVNSSGAFVNELVGDHNIIAECMADEVITECITTMID